MKRTRHSAEQIIRKLKTADQLIAQGQTVVDACRVLEASQATYHRWRQQYGGMQAEEARRLTQLEKENARLKKLLAEAELEKAMLKDLAEGNFLARSGAGGPSRSCRSVTGHPSGSSAEWWVNTAAPSAIPPGSSRSRRESCAIVSGKSQRSTSAGAAVWPISCCGGGAGPSIPSGCNGSGGRKGSSGLLPGSASGNGPQTARCDGTGLSIPTRCGPWIFSSMPRLTAADSSS